MQSTRQRILEHLKANGPATADELAGVLGLTTVTARHHLDILRSEELVAQPVVKHRSTPGRPHYEYTLTPKASAYFPKFYDVLSARLLEAIKTTAPPHTANLIFLEVAKRTLAEAPAPRPGESLPARLTRAIAYLNEHGFVASWEQTPAGYALHARNCPFESLAASHPELCSVDQSVIEKMAGTSLECCGRMAEGRESCTFLLAAEPNKSELDQHN